jgi:hypothetical protein
MVNLKKIKSHLILIVQSKILWLNLKKKKLYLFIQFAILECMGHLTICRQTSNFGLFDTIMVLKVGGKFF